MRGEWCGLGLGFGVLVRRTDVMRRRSTLKSSAFIIVLPMRIGWMGRQKKRSPNFMLPLMTQKRR